MNQKKMNQEKRNIPWSLTIFLLIFFWPLGLYLLWKKLSRDKTAVQKNSKTLQNLGYVMIGVGIIYITGIMTGAVEMFGDASLSSFITTAILIFGGSGVAMLIGSHKMRADGERYEGYMEMIYDEGMQSIHEISRKASLEYDKVISDLNKMMCIGLLEGASIDHEKGMLAIDVSSEDIDDELGI